MRYLILACLFLVGCAAEKEYIVSEPISGYMSHEKYQIEGDGAGVSYRRNDEVS